MTKQTVVLIYGGTNTEHEVSIVSARSIAHQLDSQKYQLTPVYIDHQNLWHQLHPDDCVDIHHPPQTVINPTTVLTKDNVIFPVLHGPYGEDGTIQGLLECYHVPYVGCGILASALCMDKVLQKQICLQQGLPVVPFVFTTQHKWHNDSQKTLTYIKNKLSYPLFVKPANQGSSVGVTKVHTVAELIPAIDQAFQYDNKIIIEQGVVNPQEVECSILGNHLPEVSVVGEIVSSNEFYDYNAKYVDGKSVATIPAHLAQPVTTKVKQIALKAFTVLNCSGLARVDLLIDRQTQTIFLNELNTMPGFTSISMYPKLWEASGLSYPQLLDRLIQHALERFQESESRRQSFTHPLRLTFAS